MNHLERSIFMPHNILAYLAVFVASYFVGCFNTAYLLGKRKNMDIRESGSKNPGASNAMVTMGWKAGVLVGAADIFKCALSVVVTRLIFPLVPELWFFAAFSCIIGHMFPFYLKFRGGKGLACLVGALIALDWRAFVVGGLLIIIITLVTDYMVLSTYTLSFAFPIFAYFFAGWHNSNNTWLCVILAAVTSAFIIGKHFINFKRILNGTEIGIRSAHSGKYRKDKENNGSNS